MSDPTPTQPTDLAPPTRAVVRPHKSVQRITPARKKVFLETLRQTGSMRAAAAAASPHCAKQRASANGSGPGYESFRDAIRKDPEFAEEAKAAMNEALGSAEQVLAKRMLTPDRRPIFDKQGQLLGFQEDTRNANTLLLRFLERHDSGWAPRKHVTGEMQHTHTDASLGDAAGYAYIVRSADVLALPPDERAQLIGLLEKIEAAREDAGSAPVLPAPEPEPTDG